MALPMLAGAADCGPINPLQGLTKQFDRDRGIQQDHFGAGRAGPSRETFRSQTGPQTRDQDAARFFAATTTSPIPQLAHSGRFELGALQMSLPSIHSQSQTPPQHMQQSSGGWAADFMTNSPTPQTMKGKGKAVEIPQVDMQMQMHSPSPNMGLEVSRAPMQWTPAFQNYGSINRPLLNSSESMSMQQQSASLVDQDTWDKHFQSHESSQASASTSTAATEPQTETFRTQQPIDQDDLARTAGMLVDSVREETNPKFKNSAFMGLMRQLRDREVVVEGDQMVENDGHAKGKQRAPSPVAAGITVGQSSTPFANRIGGQEHPYSQAHGKSPQPIPTKEEIEEMQRPNPAESELDAALRRDNAEFAEYWTAHHQERTEPPAATAQSAEWDRLQHEWDMFEAGATGIRQVEGYRFQRNNPYMNSTRTRHHQLHNSELQSFYDSVLELEAAVQREPSSARAWFELGVKQQENERETQALHALHQAVELDPSHLPSWLALAISYTNESDRLGTLNAINQWVNRNERYAGVLQQFKNSRAVVSEDGSTSEKMSELIECLMTMARNAGEAGIDADVQIALAVLLNTNEEYTKAQDCFRTALAVRPDDWLLYNRVGATLANSGAAEEALQYYYRALELNPAYTRARFNLGISCINLRKYEEAINNILDALLLQDSDGVHQGPNMPGEKGVTSQALWESLKLSCMHMHRMDLSAFCDQQDLHGFRAAFHGQ